MRLMRVLIAPDKFKGCLNAREAAQAIARGVLKASPDATIDLCPLSDGGEGFVEALTAASGGRLVSHRVVGPLPELRVDATLGLIDSGTTAVIEMSSAAGVAMLEPALRNPLAATTFGVGQLIRQAVMMDCRKVLLGIGGSATCDAGVGCLQACGCHVILRSGEYARETEPLCGRDLDDILMIKSGRGSRVDGVEIIVACDVTNPLYGPNGSAVVYGPQKGASPDDVRELDRMLQSLAQRLGWNDYAHEPGAGAAGGIGFGLRAVFGARMTRGFELVARATHLAERVRQADLILTGEGKLDAQTDQGKTLAGVLQLAQQLGKPVRAVAGVVEGRARGFDRTLALVDLAGDPESSMRHAPQWLERAGSVLVA
jgi:glycerate kinase